MVIVLFLIDTSASMNQRTNLGTSYLDIAKSSFDTFSKFRARDPSSRSDRYMLVTYDEPPYAVKSGWKENHGHFISELKNLQACGLSSFSRSLKEALVLLNAHRLHTCIDNYGQGRNPFYLEPTVIIVITDGHCFSTENSIQEEISLSLDESESSNLTKDPFRWDQRLFSLVLKMPGVGGGGSTLLPGEKALTGLCNSTGGRMYPVSTQKALVQSLESLTQKLHPGVVVCFRKIDSNTTSDSTQALPDSSAAVAMETSGRHGVVRTEGEPTPSGMNVVDDDGGEESWQCMKKMIYVKMNPKTFAPTGHWPIPESFWPENNMRTLPPRNSNPVIWFSGTKVNPMLVESFPFDKYELEPSALTRHILAMKEPNVCWQTFIHNSGRDEGLSHPFGYLKASSSLQAVNLFIMPFNYPRIIPLIEDLIRNHMKPPPNWRHEFAEFISTLPSYYSKPLRTAMRLLGANQALVPDFFDGQLSTEVESLLKKLRKKAKLESERIMSMVARSKGENHQQKKIRMQLYFVPDVSVGFGSLDSSQETKKPLWRTNPFDVPRHNLLDELQRMRLTLSKKQLVNSFSGRSEASSHEIPISQMGNYQEYLKKINPLRGVETGTVKTQLFGNPYRLEKNDNKRDSEEADEHMVNLGQQRRRSRSLSRGFRGRTRSPSPAPSPPPPLSPASPSSSHSQASTGGGDRLGTPDKENSTAKPVPQSIHPTAATGSPLGGGARQQGLPGQTGTTTTAAAPSSGGAMDHSGAVSPRTTAAPSLEEVSRMEASSPNDLTNSGDPRGNDVASGKLKSNLKLLKKEDRKRSPSPIDLTSIVPPLKKERSVPGEHPLSRGNQVPKGRNASSSLLPPLHSPLLSEGSSAAKVLTEEFQKQQGQENAKVKASIFKEFKKPGKNHDTVLQLLSSVKGSVDVQRTFIQDIIKEAKRWKRKGLLEQLEKRAAKLAPSKESTDDKKNSRSLPKPNKFTEGGSTLSGSVGDSLTTSSGSSADSLRTSLPGSKTPNHNH